MSRRASIAGLLISVTLLLITVMVMLEIGPSLPGPPVRTWFGMGEPLPDLCTVDPGKIRDPAGTTAAGAWRKEASSPTPSPEFGAATVGAYVYLAGGQLREGTEKTVLRFDPRTDAYRRETDLPVALDHPVAAAHDGNVIVAGGYIDGADATNRAWEYSPRTRRWRELPAMQFRRGAAAGAVVGDRLYIAGGLDQFGNQYAPTRSMEIYDFDQRRWLKGPDMPTARHHFGAAALNGKIYFAGGRQLQDLSLAALEEFDPATNRWYRLPPMPVGAGAAGVAALDGKIVVTGGGDDTNWTNGGGWVLRTAYAYDPASRRWTRLPDMGRARHGQGTATVDGRVYVFRGIPCPGYGEMSSVESLGFHRP